MHVDGVRFVSRIWIREYQCRMFGHIGTILTLNVVCSIDTKVQYEVKCFCGSCAFAMYKMNV